MARVLQVFVVAAGVALAAACGSGGDAVDSPYGGRWISDPGASPGRLTEVALDIKGGHRYHLVGRLDGKPISIDQRWFQSRETPTRVVLRFADPAPDERSTAMVVEMASPQRGTLHFNTLAVGGEEELISVDVTRKAPRVTCRTALEHAADVIDRDPSVDDQTRRAVRDNLSTGIRECEKEGSQAALDCMVAASTYQALIACDALRRR